MLESHFGFPLHVIIGFSDWVARTCSVWCCSFVGPFHKATKLQRQTAKSEATAPNGQYKATMPNGQSTKSQHPMGILLLYHTWPPLPDKATTPNGQYKATAPNEQPQSYKQSGPPKILLECLKSDLKGILA